MRLLCLAALICVSVTALTDARHAQSAPGGQGASAFASDARQFLHEGPLIRTPGETFDVLQSLPPNFPLALIPESAVPTIASVSPSMTVVVATTKADRRFDSNQQQAKLEATGWTRTGPLALGFTPSVTGVTLCRAAEFVTYTARDVANGDRLVRIALSREPSRSCTRGGDMLFRSFDVDIPTLTPPPGARRVGAGSSAGIFESGAYSRLETRLTVESRSSGPVTAI